MHRIALEELQKDVDKWLIQYNQFRPHSGTRCFGKTPLQTFEQAKSIAQEAQLENRCELNHNSNELAKFELASTEDSSNFGSIAPSANVDNKIKHQGAKPNESEKDLDLTDNFFVS